MKRITRPRLLTEREALVLTGVREKVEKEFAPCASHPPAPISYPARPMNGGGFLSREPLIGNWSFKPKYNGRRVLFHRPTLRTWNRQLVENTWGTTKPAFKQLKELLEMGDVHPMVFEWMDVEFLWGKHSIGKGAIVVLDYVSINNELWHDRQINLNVTFQPDRPLDTDNKPLPNEVYFAKPMPEAQTLKCWEEMQEINKAWGATFYEGLVAYDMRSRYPVQLFSPLRETRHWMKYRFIN